MDWSRGFQARKPAFGRVGFFIVSHESRRENVRKQTLEHLKTRGIEAEVFEQVGPPAPFKLRRTVGAALNSMTAPGGLVMLEDDVRARPDWQPVMREAVRSNHPTILCSLAIETIPAPYCYFIRERVDPSPITARVVPLVRPATFFGTQAVYLPPWFVECIKNDPALWSETPHHEAFDTYLNTLMRTNPNCFGMNLAVPDAFQHTSPPSVASKDRPKREAHMFHWQLP